MTTDILICSPTAIGTFNGSLKNIPAPKLGATVMTEVIKRAGLVPEKVQAVVMG